MIWHVHNRTDRSLTARIIGVPSFLPIEDISAKFYHPMLLIGSSLGLNCIEIRIGTYHCNVRRLTPTIDGEYISK